MLGRRHRVFGDRADLAEWEPQLEFADAYVHGRPFCRWMIEVRSGGLGYARRSRHCDGELCRCPTACWCSTDRQQGGSAMGGNAGGRDGADYLDKHYVHRDCVRPGQSQTSPIWNAYLKPLVDPFVDEDIDLRYCDEDELHDLIWQRWTDAGVDNDVSIDHELDLSEGTSAAKAAGSTSSPPTTMSIGSVSRSKARDDGPWMWCRPSSSDTPRPGRSTRCCC
ncbi:hypothetical protein [Nocardia fluminea]|uniref:hypothetical protein n=1 Tax=Nocardia fluminea TaxID=134984 RepID=UPI00364B7ED6